MLCDLVAGGNVPWCAMVECRLKCTCNPSFWRAMKKLMFIKRSNGNHWVGDGFPVRNIFSYGDIAEDMSPFLLMDYAGPANFSPTQDRLGVGAHPHRVCCTRNFIARLFQHRAGRSRWCSSG